MNQKKILPNVASFLISEDCNLACTYCFELDKHNKKEMSKEVARKSIDFLADNALQNGDRYFSVMLFGGEPLMNIKTIEEVFRYGLEVGRKYNLDFTCSMVTNATILTKEVERVLKKYKDDVDLNVQLSVDGIKEIQDAYRITRAGTGSFDMVEKNIPKWKDIFKNNPRALSIHGCNNKETLPYLYENYILFKEEWGFEHIWFMPIHSEDWRDEDVLVYEEQLNKIKDYILNLTRKNKNIQEILNYAPLDRCIRPDCFPLAPCGAGKSFMTITADGDFWPCHQIYFNDPNKYYKMGNLNSGIDEGKRALFLYLDNSDFSCATTDPDCDAYACYRCMGDNLLANGSVLSVVDCQGPRCKMSKVERKIQLEIRKEIEDMGLINRTDTNVNYEQGNNPNNPACLCDILSDGKNKVGNNPENPACLCDVDFGGVNIIEDSKKNTCSCDNENADNTIALALNIIIDKLEIIEKGQEHIIKKILE